MQTQTPRLHYIEYRGHSILFLDLSELRDLREGLELARSMSEVAACAPATSLLTLTDVRGALLDPRLTAAMREMAEHNAPFVRRSAVVGLSAPQRVAYEVVQLLTGRKVLSFSDLDAAKEWLVADTAPVDE